MNQAADNYQVPRSTLKDRLGGRVTHGVNPGPKPHLTKDEGQGLADYLISAANIGYGKTRRDVLCLVETYLRQKESLKALSVRRGWWHTMDETDIPLCPPPSRIVAKKGTEKGSLSYIRPEVTSNSDWMW